MKYNFNEESIIVTYIKELLHSFNLPMLPVITEDTELIEGRTYIQGNKVLKYENGKLNEISLYLYNKPTLNLTKNLIINSSEYDSYTHYYLGDYLRFLRDYKEINLMGMYNCFGQEKPERIEYSQAINNDIKFSINTSLQNYNYYIVPIKFDQIYTISIDAEVKYEIACILYNNIFISNTPEDLIKQSYKCINGSKFNSPFIYSTKFDCVKDLWPKEKDLKLILKLPKDINSSITILEGNFTPCANVVDGTYVTNYIINEEKLPSLYYGKNSLLLLNNGKSYPFSDRLVEYLFDNTISNVDQIKGNIEFVQDIIYKNINFEGYYGIWDNNLRSLIYEKLLDTDITRGNSLKYGNTIEYTENNESIEKRNPKRFIDIYSDITGYVDKDVEHLLRLLNDI